MFKKTANIIRMPCICFNYIIDFEIENIYNVSP